MNAAECDNNNGQGDDNIAYVGRKEIFLTWRWLLMRTMVTLCAPVPTILDKLQVKYSYDSQTVHTKMDEEIRRADVEKEDGSNYKEIALDYLSDDNCSNNCDYIQMGYYTINVTADYPAACEFGNDEAHK